MVIGMCLIMWLTKDKFYVIMIIRRTGYGV